MLNSGRWERTLDIPPLDVTRLISRYGIEVHSLPEGDPNHADVINRIEVALQANLAMNIHCLRLFRPELLSHFEMTTNYHNGSLPAFQGLRASNWSIYMGQLGSGYSFHRMDQGLDTGNLLLTGEVAVSAEETPGELELLKAIDARRHLPALLDSFINRELGQQQHGVGCTHNRTAHELITQVTAPSSLSQEEWQRRLRSFQRITTHLNGHKIPVTSIAAAHDGDPLSFRSADGIWLKVSGIDFWPASWIRRLRQGEKCEQ
jgi:methionyl-tRNA formyltransferase